MTRYLCIGDTKKDFIHFEKKLLILEGIYICLMFVAFCAAGDVNVAFTFCAEKKMSIKMSVRRNLLVTDRAGTYYSGSWNWITVRTSVDCTRLVFGIKAFINAGYYVFSVIKI